MYWSIDDELLAAYRHQQGNPLILSAGVFRKTSGFCHVYAFALSVPAAYLRRGQQVQCAFGAIELLCTVVRKKGRRLCLALPRNLGASIRAGGTVSTDTTFVLEGLHRRLTAGIRAFTLGKPCSPPFNGDAALRIIGAGAFAASECHPSTVVFRRGPALNEAQQNAVLLAFRSNACFLFGPPGTGKTTTLARVVEAHVLAGRSVLVLGPTNRAVDLLLRAVANRVLSAPSSLDGRVLRLGALADYARLGARADQVCLERVVDRIRSQRYEPALARLARLAAAADAEEKEVTAQLTRGVDGLGPRQSCDRVDRLHRRLARAVGLQRHVSAQQRRIEIASALLPRRLLEQCEVLGTTIHQTYLSSAFRRQFDVVVIDETSMLSAVQVYVAAGLAKAPNGQVIVAGDYRQLSPIARAVTDRADAWVRADIFQTVGIPTALDCDDDPWYVGVLNEQHRMSPGICELVSHLFYGDRLHTATAVLERAALPSPLGGGDVFCIDSTSVAPKVRRANNTSRENRTHRILIEDLLAELDSAGAIVRSGHTAVAVISPFRAQVSALKRRLGKRYAGQDVKITTVHKAQGSEAEIVILDLTDAPGLPVSGFLGSKCRRAEGARLLNVAMSRARQQLYIVGALDHLERLGNQVTRELIAYLRENAELVPLRLFKGSAAQVYGPRRSRVAQRPKGASLVAHTSP